jgi:glycosyltransferase involved in cell wall biosynthesis
MTKIRAFPRHLAILLPTLGGGGAERTMLKLAGGFRSHGYQVDLILVHLEGSLISEIPEHVRIIDLKAPRRLTSRALTSLPALIGYLRDEHPDILYTGLMTNLIALWAKKLARISTRVIISERNIPSVEIKQFPRDFRFRLIPAMTKIFYPWADGIVAVSQAVANDLVKITGIQQEKIRVIYNPVITPVLLEKSNSPIVHPWFAPDQPPVVLAVGRLTTQKDHPTLLKAFALVHQSRPVRLLILGEGDERHHLEIQSKNLGIEMDVQFAGFIENPYPYMKKASLFVHSSQFEGLPGVLIEALFCGVPIIATDCPGGSREILADGKYGQLVPVGDPLALARAIERSLANHSYPVSDQSWKPFEIENILKQYMAYFNEICVDFQKN